MLYRNIIFGISIITPSYIVIFIEITIFDLSTDKLLVFKIHVKMI